MSIILKENEWAKQMIDRQELGQKPSETLKRVARYYIDQGMSRADARKMLDKFLLCCDHMVSVTKWSDAMDFAMKNAVKYKAVDIDYIPVTRTEMKKIDSLKGKQLRRLAFTLLCLAKYWHCVVPSNDYWVNNKDSEIMSLANVSTSIKRQCLMYGKLKDCGMISFSKKVDNTNVKVCFVDDSDDVVLKVDDFRNLGYQYLKFHGEPYFKCECCGIVTKYSDPKNSRNQIYCEPCSLEMAVQKRVNWTMRCRDEGVV